jgi:hypothetical protein
MEEIMLAELVKLAYVLDKKGEYELARSVDEVVQSMAERVGLNIEELVSLADYFDAEGEVELANRFDGMLDKLSQKKRKHRIKPGKVKARNHQREQNIRPQRDGGTSR